MAREQEYLQHIEVGASSHDASVPGESSGVAAGNPRAHPYPVFGDWSQVRIEWLEPIMLRLNGGMTEKVRAYLSQMGIRAKRRDKAAQLKLRNDSLRVSISKGGFLQIWPRDLKAFPLEFSRFLRRCGLGSAAAQEVVARVLEASKATRVAVEVPLITNALTRNLLRGASLEYAKGQSDNQTRVPPDGSGEAPRKSDFGTVQVKYDRSKNPLEAEMSGDVTNLIDFFKAMGAI